MPLENAKRCSHIQVTGHRCGSPALKHREFCYFHERLIRGVALPRHARVEAMFVLDNEESIQCAIMEVMNSILMKRLDYKSAALLLRALNLAVRNSRRTHFGDQPLEMVRELPQELPEDESLPSDEQTDATPLSKPLASTTASASKEAKPASQLDRKPQPPSPVIPSKSPSLPLTNRQASQWSEIRSLQKSMEGAVRGNLEDIKTCFAAAGLYPPPRKT